MSWGEVWRLTQELLKEPSSHVAAAVAGWERPWTPEAYVLADVFDLLARVNTDRKHVGRLKPYPRPNARKPTRLGARRVRSQRDIRAALAARGHTLPA